MNVWPSEQDAWVVFNSLCHNSHPLNLNFLDWRITLHRGKEREKVFFLRMQLLKKFIWTLKKEETGRD